MSSKNIVWHEHKLSKSDRAKIKHQKPTILWFTGLSGSGKSSIANAVEERLYESGIHTYLLDGDNIRSGLNSDLGFSDSDRVENIRRIAEVAKLFLDAGLIVLCAFISPHKSQRDKIRDMVEEGEFIEIFIDTPIEICVERDPKGLYKKAKAGEIKNFTGIDSIYEAPENPEIRIDTTQYTIEESADIVVNYLKEKGYTYVTQIFQ